MRHTAIFTLQRIVRKFATRAVSLLIGMTLFLGLQLAVEAAPADTPGGNPEKTITGESVDQLRAERRAMNSQAARAAIDEEKGSGKADSLGKVINEKLNLDEIVEENVIVDDARDALDLDAPREIPRRGR